MSVIIASQIDKLPPFPQEIDPIKVLRRGSIKTNQNKPLRTANPCFSQVIYAGVHLIKVFRFIKRKSVTLMTDHTERRRNSPVYESIIKPLIEVEPDTMNVSIPADLMKMLRVGEDIIIKKGDIL